MVAPGSGAQVHLTPVLRTLEVRGKYFSSTYRPQIRLIFSQMSLGVFHFYFKIISDVSERRWDFLK